jgi:hypothetical protein
MTMSGCLVVVAGAAGGTVAYVKGALTANLPNPIVDVQKATKKALTKDLNFVLINSSEDAVTAVYHARNAKDEKIEIRLDLVTDTTTKIDIRIGTFGNETLSQLILQKIQKRLDD